MKYDKNLKNYKATVRYFVLGMDDSGGEYDSPVDVGIYVRDVSFKDALDKLTKLNPIVAFSDRFPRGTEVSETPVEVIDLKKVENHSFYLTIE